MITSVWYRRSWNIDTSLENAIAFNYRYNVMLACWHPTPVERPTFSRLKDTFDGILTQGLQPDNAYISFNLEGNQDYYTQSQEYDI